MDRTESTDKKIQITAVWDNDYPSLALTKCHKAHTTEVILRQLSRHLLTLLYSVSFQPPVR